jgi:dihydropteroate synthase
MGALNVSPESFYTGSVHRLAADLVSAALVMVEAGAALIDVGARSTAPYRATAVGEDEERDRLARAVEALAGKVPVPISADTARARVARAALDAGARVINDVSGLRDPSMGALVRERGVGLILMASPERAGGGGPSSTTLSTAVSVPSARARSGLPPEARGLRPAPAPRSSPVACVKRLLEAALERARAAGIAEEHLVLDPGLGFFRDEPVPWDEWDVEVLTGLGSLAALGRPLCVGVSRKSFIGAITGRDRPQERLAGSLAATTVAVLNGAALIRTHDVAETLDAVRVAERMRRAAGR